MGDHLSDAGRRSLDEALKLAEVDPERALAEVESLRSGAGGQAWSDSAIAWVRGVALRRLGHHDRARSSLAQAVEILDQTGSRADAARVRTALASEELERGSVDAALDLLAAAESGLRGVEAARVAAQRALVLQRAGRVTDTLDEWTRAMRAFRRAGATALEGRARGTRGLVHVYRGEYAAAEADLTAAEQLFTAVDDQIGVAEARHNQGFLAARRGDLPGALRLFDDAQRRLGRQGVARPEMLLDRVETLLDGGLAAEAGAVGRTALDQLAEAGRETDRAEACLLVARAAHESGDHAEAVRLAAEARELFARQGRPRWELLAEYRQLRVSAAASAGSPVAPGGAASPEVLATMAGRLEEAGWAEAALEACAGALAGWCTGGRVDAARESRAHLARMRRRAPALGRLESWLAESRCRVAEGDGPGAGRALGAALGAAREHQAGLGSVELRARVAAHTARVIEVGVSLAAADGRADRALRWIEEARCAEGGVLPARRDEETTAAIESLRQLTTRAEREPLAPRDRHRLRRQQAALEELIRRRSRYAPGPPDGDAFGALPVAALREALGPRLLIEYAVCDDHLVAVVSRTGRISLHRLGSLTGVRRAVAGLRLAIQAELRGPAPASSSAVAAAARAVSDLVLAPLLEGRPVESALVVPAGPVASVAWATLEPLRSADVVVAPSATAWARAGAWRGPRRGARVLSVAGPGLRRAGEEAHRVAEVWGAGTTVLSGPDASVSATLAAFERAEVVHVAAHGTFRGDNPILSSIRLEDGALTAYELLQRRRAPRLVVFSACDAGMADSDAAGTFGLCSLLNRKGVATSVASVTPVSDEHSPELMVELHRLVRSGVPAGRAVAGMRGAGDGAADGFVCFGAG